MKQVECVPNFSEGRDRGVLDAIAETFRAPGVRLLDFSADPDHNRSVATVVGEPHAVAGCVIDAAGLAARSIDMRRHAGEHPAIGATDVVPFVPLEEMTMAEAAALAADTAQGIAVACDIPTYLYGEAARREHCVNLADVRRGGFKELGARMKTMDWIPDFGPMRPHPTAGATAVGARKFLVAFNVNLGTSDVAVAKAIAHRIRERDGGLPRVKALGVFLAERGCAQVTMNLVDYEITPPLAAVRKIAEMAQELGTEIAESEIIGLVPRAALSGTTAAELRYPGDLEERILENRLI